MKVYRIEGEDGMGPYAHDDARKFSSKSSRTKPTPVRDGIEAPILDAIAEQWKIDNALFGFESIASAMKWFHTKEERAYLKELDLHLAVYEVNCAVVLKHQVIFHKGSAVRESVTPLEKLAEFA